MTERPTARKPGCREFQRNIYHLQAGELPDEQAEALAVHAEACTACAERLVVEDAFLRALRRKLTREPAPPGLQARVRSALERDAVPATIWHWLHAPWFMPAAAALVLALVLIPALPAWDSLGGVVLVEREVTVVDYTCDRAGVSLSQQRQCPLVHHLNALKVGPDDYWILTADQVEASKLMVDPEMRGHRLLVEGELDTRNHTLKLARFADRGEVIASALPAAVPLLLIAAVP